MNVRYQSRFSDDPGRNRFRISSQIASLRRPITHSLWMDYVADGFPRQADPAPAVPRPQDATSPGEPASHDSSPAIAPTSNTPTDEDKDQGVEDEKLHK